MRIVLAALVAVLASFSAACSEGQLTSPTSPSSAVANPAPPPTISLASLSEEARRFVLDYNINHQYQATNGVSIGLKRWEKFPIAVYATPYFNQAHLADAIKVWQDATEGKVTFSIVQDRDTADVVFSDTWPPPYSYPIPATACGVEAPDRIQNNVILSGYGYYAFRVKPECAGNGDQRIGLAHGLGHILGFGGHPPGTDLMGAVTSTGSMSLLTKEIVNFLYDSPANARPMQ